jgi:hypothetical protein
MTEAMLNTITVIRTGSEPTKNDCSINDSDGWCPPPAWEGATMRHWKTHHLSDPLESYSVTHHHQNRCRRPSLSFRSRFSILRMHRSSRSESFVRISNFTEEGRAREWDLILFAQSDHSLSCFSLDIDQRECVDIVCRTRSERMKKAVERSHSPSWRDRLPARSMADSHPHQSEWGIVLWLYQKMFVFSCFLVAMVDLWQQLSIFVSVWIVVSPSVQLRSSVGECRIISPIWIFSLLTYFSLCVCFFSRRWWINDSGVWIVPNNEICWYILCPWNG